MFSDLALDQMWSCLVGVCVFTMIYMNSNISLEMFIMLSYVLKVYVCVQVGAALPKCQHVFL